MSNSKLLAAVFGGAAAGAILGILMAPQSGEETRKQLAKSARDSADSLDTIIEDGKKTWYETKGKAKMGAGIAADELDDFMRHILKSGQRLWKKTKDKSEEVVNNVEDTVQTAVANGKKTANYAAEHLS